MRIFPRRCLRFFFGYLLRIRVRAVHGAIFTVAMGVISAFVILLCFDANFSHGFVHDKIRSDIDVLENEVDDILNNIDDKNNKTNENEEIIGTTEGIEGASKPPVGGILYPQESESREIKSLNGIWNFRLAPAQEPEKGFLSTWFSQPLAQTGEVDMMPVPSSYNDITQSSQVRDHIGWVWYDRNFFVPKSWESNRRRIFLRFGAVHYQAVVYVNGVQVAEHSGGSLPFLAELPASKLNFKTDNRITVAVNNQLSYDTIPQGWTNTYSPADEQSWFQYPEGYMTQGYDFDFFNYAGIHRSVFLYTTPEEYIEDIDVTPSIVRDTGFLTYFIKVKDRDNKVLSEGLTSQISVSLEDKNGHVVAKGESASGELAIPKAKLWWPRTMVPEDSDAGYLYTFVIRLKTGENDGDVYRLKVGIRSISWNNKEVRINGKPFYFRGYGRHEDFNVRGKGIDDVMIVKDHNLIKWTGGNSYRTSHYPYAEEIMDLADRLGIVIIDEVASVSTYGFHDVLLNNHLNQVRELIRRDKNRACVMVWSLANEAKTAEAPSEAYFKTVIELARELDKNRRPITLVTASSFQEDVAAKFVDIIAVNRYYGWYSESGRTEIIARSVVAEMQNWVKTFDKPVMMAEYGADTVAGIHMEPSTLFSEEFQVEFLREHFKAFDFLRRNTSFIGEHIWNFADFQTAQKPTRVGGNKKGIFTRDRQPKSSAHIVRHRYHLLAQEIDQYPLPKDVKNMIPIYNDEL